MKKNYLATILLLLISLGAHSQIVNIPDSNFKNALLNDNVVDLDNNGSGDSDADTNNDGEIQVSEALSVTSLNLYQKGISSLTGIEEFSNLEMLDIEMNELTNIDILSQNSSLFYLDAESNEITSVDLSSNTALEYLYLNLNNLTSLDISQNTNMVRLGCYGNNLSSLNIQNGNNTNLIELYALNNPNLNCVQVDDVAYANNQTCNQNAETGFCVDDSVTFNTNCNLSIKVPENIEISVYPNPTASIVKIKSSDQIREVVVYSVFGKRVLAQQNTTSLDLSKLNSGMYFMNVKTNHKEETIKVIKK